jgi:hypothetical protein
MISAKTIHLSYQDSKRLKPKILKPLKLLLTMVLSLLLLELEAEFLEIIPTELLTQLPAHQHSQSMITTMVFSLSDTVKLSLVNNISLLKILSERTGVTKDMQ